MRWVYLPGQFRETGFPTADGFITVAGRIDPASRTLPVVFAVDNPGERLPLGAFVDAHLVTGPPLAVPTTAVLTEAGQAAGPCRGPRRAR